MCRNFIIDCIDLKPVVLLYIIQYFKFIRRACNNIRFGDFAYLVRRHLGIAAHYRDYRAGVFLLCTAYQLAGFLSPLT